MRASLGGWVRPWRIALSGVRHSLLRQIRLRQLERIAVPEAPVIARAIRSAVRGDCRSDCQPIEAERQRLLSCDAALVDGTLGAGSPFDQGQTIEAACRVSRSPAGGLLLYHLARALKPRQVIELGTNVGISSAYLASALARNSGQLVTLEFSPYRQRIAQLMHERLTLRNVTHVRGAFAETLCGVLQGLPSVDLAFIDGDHHLQPTLDYFAAILRRISERAVLVFDDIRWSKGMLQAWDAVRKHPQVRLSVNLHNMGLCVVESRPATGATFHVGPIRC